MDDAQQSPEQLVAVLASKDGVARLNARKAIVQLGSTAVAPFCLCFFRQRSHHTQWRTAGNHGGRRVTVPGRQGAKQQPETIQSWAGTPLFFRDHVALLICVLLIAVLPGAGCSQAPPSVEAVRTTPETSSSISHRIVTENVLQADRRTLQSSSTHLESTIAELQKLAMAAPWRESGFFDAEQQDQIENLLFRFLACRDALWRLASLDHDNDAGYSSDDVRTKSTAIAFNAGFYLLVGDASLVTTFRDDSIAVAKLNEEFYRSRIPAKTYDDLFLAVTNEDRLNALRNSFLLYTEELVRSDSPLSKVVREEPDYSDLVKTTEAIATHADAMVRKLVESESSLLPEIDNRLRHTQAAALLRESENTTNELLSAARAHLFKGVSRIKNPDAHLIRFSAKQKHQLVGLLQPGDIILTYTAGYISDIFIPGTFKHAITYVGSVEDRHRAGLHADHLAWIPDTERDGLLRAINTAGFASGQDVNVIEAVGEGVIFNSLGHIMDTHINRLLILRPQISPDERIRALVDVFRFLGDGYDFRFDFADASEQVCTEVVYRALDGKGAIKFTLVERAGHPTLSADDIANSYLVGPGKTFEFVLLAEETPSSEEHRALVLVGKVGAKRLADLMAGSGKNKE